MGYTTVYKFNGATDHSINVNVRTEFEDINEWGGWSDVFYSHFTLGSEDGGLTVWPVYDVENDHWSFNVLPIDGGKTEIAWGYYYELSAGEMYPWTLVIEVPNTTTRDYK